MTTCCVDNYDTCITRGDTFKLDVGLSSAYSEVINNPADYIARMVFREAQDDGLTPYLTLSAVAEVNPDPLIDEPPVLFRFSASPAETQSLPDWDHVHYVQLEQIVAPSDITRLFQGKVKVGD